MNSSSDRMSPNMAGAIGFFIGVLVASLVYVVATIFIPTEAKAAATLPKPAKGCYTSVSYSSQGAIFTVKGHNMSGHLKANFKGYVAKPFGKSEAFTRNNYGIPFTSTIKGHILQADSWINGVKCKQYNDPML